jgi:hypothetical protein
MPQQNYCKHCTGYTFDDMYGHCLSCGAPRDGKYKKGVEVSFPKLFRDGKVAVLYSPQYGAGWSTWNDNKDCIFDPDIALIVLGENEGNIKELAQRKWGEKYFCDLGAGELEVEWIQQGQCFDIKEYDGFESIEYGGTLVA